MSTGWRLVLAAAMAWSIGSMACGAAKSEPTFPPITAPHPDGKWCFKGSDCQSGICEGKGCGPRNPGVCSPKYRICQDDEVEAVADCPSQRYKSVQRCQ